MILCKLVTDTAAINVTEQQVASHYVVLMSTLFPGLFSLDISIRKKEYHVQGRYSISE